jgi:hypothetical protein
MPDMHPMIRRISAFVIEHYGTKPLLGLFAPGQRFRAPSFPREK